MKRIKDILDFLVSLVTTWKVIIPIVLIIAAAVLKLFKFAAEIYTLTLPLWVFIVFSILVLYPIANFIKFVIKNRKIKCTKLYGILWKPSIIPFINPKPICPIDNCGCEIIYKSIPPKTLHVVSSISEINNIDRNYHYKYECPIHGQLNNIPDEKFSTLQMKAKLAIRKVKI